MSVVTMTNKSLSEQLGEEVPEIYVIIAKHEVLALNTSQIATAIGLTQEEILEVQSDEVYKKVLLLIRVEHSRTTIDQSFTYDSLENIALEKLHKKVQFEQDAEFLLKVAVMANRATRRHEANKPLEPGAAAARVPLTLTNRLVRKLQTVNGTMEQIEERSVSISDGSAIQPSFKDVDALLSVSARPQLSPNIESKLLGHDPSVDDLMKDFPL